MLSLVDFDQRTTFELPDNQSIYLLEILYFKGLSFVCLFKVNKFPVILDDFLGLTSIKQLG